MVLSTSPLTQKDIDATYRAHVRQHEEDIGILKRHIEMLKDEITIIKKEIKSNAVQKDRT